MPSVISVVESLPLPQSEEPFATEGTENTEELQGPLGSRCLGNSCVRFVNPAEYENVLADTVAIEGIERYAGLREDP